MKHAVLLDSLSSNLKKQANYRASYWKKINRGVYSDFWNDILPHLLY